MTKAFTIYWTPEGWAGLREGEPIRFAGGTGFATKIDPTSRVYVTNIKDGRLRLLGAFTVAKVLLARNGGRPPEATIDKPEYLIAKEGSSAPFGLRHVPDAVVGSLRFVGKRPAVTRTTNFLIDGQAMRSIRQLTPLSAEALEAVLEIEATQKWTEEELKASVSAYLDLAHRIREGQHVIKKAIYKDLSTRFGRSEGAFEYRMQNISYVLSLMGREWIAGLAPAKNVGADVGAHIELLIGELEGKQPPLLAAEALKVARTRKTQTTRPSGSKTPKVKTTTLTAYVRDLAVKAWVLERAEGKCEACSIPAPFKGADGFPFLEVHHVRHLADGGSDAPTNAVALCPNCHRRLHYSDDMREYREGLFANISELVKE